MKSLSGKTVAAPMARLVVMGAGALGIPHERLLESIHLTQETLNDPDARVPVETMIDLWGAATRLTGDENFGLRLSAAVSPYQEVVIGYIVRASANLGEAIPRALRYERLVQDDARTVIVKNEERVTLLHPPRESGLPMPRPTIEFMFANMTRLVRESTGQPFVPQAVSFAHGPPENQSLHHQVFGPNVTFNAADHTLTFDATVLLAPLLEANPTLLAIIEAKANAALASFRDEDPFLAALRSRILGNLDNANLDAVAKKLAMSSRSLQRKLQSLGTTFGTVADEVRRKQADIYVADPMLSLRQTAYLLGFSDQSAFNRAFLRWHGEAPRRYRATVKARRS